MQETIDESWIKTASEQEILVPVRALKDKGFRCLNPPVFDSKDPNHCVVVTDFGTVRLSSGSGKKIVQLYLAGFRDFKLTSENWSESPPHYTVLPLGGTVT